MTETTFAIKVGGEYACFTRPDFKAERVSYPVMTPSAARGLLESIFWKPEFRWEIREIWVLRPIRHMFVLRNELDARQGDRPLLIERHRQLRGSLVLKDVAYVIRAAMRLRAHATAPLAKYADQFRRRLTHGQYHHTPYLGTREFAAWFEPVRGDETPYPVSADLGWMVFDIAFQERPDKPQVWFVKPGPQRRTVAGIAQTLFFPAQLREGVLRIPPEYYTRLYRQEDDYAE